MIYTWLKSEDSLTSKKPGPRGPYRLIYEALKQHVIDFPDHTQLERASHFGVSKHCIWYALRKMKSREKKQFGYKEQCAVKRDTYVSALTAALCEGKAPVYIDESGFTIEAVRHYAYAPRGAIVSDLRSSQQYRSTSLIAARLSDDFIAPLLFTGACNTERFNEWLETHLCAHLDQTHVVILDNGEISQKQSHTGVDQRMRCEPIIFASIFTGFEPD